MNGKEIMARGGWEHIHAMHLDQQNRQTQELERRHEVQLKDLKRNMESLWVYRCRLPHYGWQKLRGQEEILDKLLVNKALRPAIIQGVLCVVAMLSLIALPIAGAACVLIPQVLSGFAFASFGNFIATLIVGVGVGFVGLFVSAHISMIPLMLAESIGDNALDFLWMRRKLRKTGEYRRVLEEFCGSSSEKDADKSGGRID